MPIGEVNISCVADKQRLRLSLPTTDGHAEDVSKNLHPFSYEGRTHRLGLLSVTALLSARGNVSVASNPGEYCLYD